MASTGSITQHTAAATGVLHRLYVPRMRKRRHVWIAADALRSETIAPWYINATIRFKLGNLKVAEFPIRCGNTLAPSVAMNIFAPSSGAGAQPALKVTALESVVQQYKSVTLPCFEFVAECDQIEYEVFEMARGYSGGQLYATKLSLVTCGDMRTGSLTPTTSRLFVDGPSDCAIQNLFGLETGVISGVTGYVIRKLTNESDAVGIINTLCGTMTAAPTLKPQYYNGSAWVDMSTTVPGAGSTPPTFRLEMDGQADVLTGLIVISQEG